MNEAWASEQVSKIVIDNTSSPSWQDQAMNSLQQTIGPWGITVIILLVLGGLGFWLYKKKFKKSVS